MSEFKDQTVPVLEPSIYMSEERGSKYFTSDYSRMFVRELNDAKSSSEWNSKTWIKYPHGCTSELEASEVYLTGENTARCIWCAKDLELK